MPSLTAKKPRPEPPASQLPPEIVDFIRALADAAAIRDHKRELAEPRK